MLIIVFDELLCTMQTVSIEKQEAVESNLSKCRELLKVGQPAES